MSLLIYSPQCNHSLDVINYINKHPQLKQIVRYHNINQLGIPPQYKNKLTRVPTMLTKNGKLLVGNEIRNWLESLLPTQELETCNFSGASCSSTSLDDNESSGELFGLDNYGRSLQPAMTQELEDKINQSVSDAYNKNIKK